MPRRLFARVLAPGSPERTLIIRFLRRLLQIQLGGGVFAEEGVIADVAAHSGEGFVAGLAHDIEFGGVIQIRLRDEAGAQTVPGKACLIEAGALDGAFQNARHRSRMQPLVLQPSETVDAAEHWPCLDTALLEPALIRAHGTSRCRRAIRNADGSPGAFLVGLRAIGVSTRPSALCATSSTSSAQSSERRRPPAKPTSSKVWSRQPDRSAGSSANTFLRSRVSTASFCVWATPAVR